MHVPCYLDNIWMRTGYLDIYIYIYIYICKTYIYIHWYIAPRQITIIPKPELRGSLGDSLTKPSKVTSAEVAIICPDPSISGCLGVNFHWGPPRHHLGFLVRYHSGHPGESTQFSVFPKLGTLELRVQVIFKFSRNRQNVQRWKTQLWKWTQTTNIDSLENRIVFINAPTCYSSYLSWAQTGSQPGRVTGTI